MPDLDEGLEALAQHAARTSRLEPAAGVRLRADRRRRRRHAAAVAAAAVAVVMLGVGVAVAQPDRADQPPLPGASSPAPGPSFSLPPNVPLRTDPSFGPRGLHKNLVGLQRQRAYALAPVTTTPDQPGILLGGDGRFTVPAAGTGTRFTVADVGADPLGSERWVIRVAEKNGSRCLAVRDNGALSVSRCDPAQADQRFELHLGPGDSYGIVGVESQRWLTWDRRPGSTSAMTDEAATSWYFLDVGPSTSTG